MKIISPAHDALTLAVRDFLDRMGMPNRVWTPDSEVGRTIEAMPAMAEASSEFSVISRRTRGDNT